MSGAYIASHVDAVLAEHGEAATLARVGETTISLYAKRYGSNEIDIGGSAAQSAVTLKIGTAALAASAWTDKFPKRSDKLTLGGRGRTVLDVDVRKDGATTTIYILTVAG